MLLEITYVEEVNDPKYRVLADGSYVIGFGFDRADIVLADSTVAPKHALLTIGEGKIMIEDLDSRLGTFLDDQVIEGPTAVEPGQPIRIGDTVLRVTLGERLPEKNDGERRFPTETESGFQRTLAANPADDDTRLVYLDWLEAEGHRFTANYIRAELANDVDVWTSEALGKAVHRTTPEWRLLISRARIVGCRESGCPARWHLLEATTNLLVRTCTTCRQRVVYCRTVEDVTTASDAGTRIVLDATIARAHGYYRPRSADPDDRDDDDPWSDDLT